MKYFISILGLLVPAFFVASGFQNCASDPDRDPASASSQISVQAVTTLPNPPTDSLHCEYRIENTVVALADYDPTANTLTTSTGNPPAQQTFSGITLVSGLPPYGNDGLTFITFGDVPLIHVQVTSTIDGNFLSTWGVAPGGPSGVLNAGVCTLGSDPGGGGGDGDGEDCTHTQGFFKTHGPSPRGNNDYVWPASVRNGGLKLGDVSYSAAQLLAIFETPPKKGNGLISLAHQLIAAKLNILSGADGSAVASAIASADALIGSLIIPPVGSGFLPSRQTSDLTSQLDSFNQGSSGPGHCD